MVASQRHPRFQGCVALLGGTLLLWAPLSPASADWSPARTTLAAQVGPSNAPVPPNVLFIVDASASMGGCFDAERYDTNGDGTLDTCRAGSRLGAVREVLADAIRGAGPARFALAQTDPSIEHFGIGTKPGPFSPQGSITRPGIVSPFLDDRWGFDAALANLTLNQYDAISLSESLRDALFHFWRGNLHCTDTERCANSPVDYSCQENYVIVLTDGTSQGQILVDRSPYFNGTPIFPDVAVTRNKDMDNLAAYLADGDRSSPIGGGIAVKTYVVGLDINNYFDSQLFENVARQADTDYIEVYGVDALKGAVSRILQEITEGSYQQMPPVISSVLEDSWRSTYSDGIDHRVQSVMVGWYTIAGTAPLQRGQLSSYTLDADPRSATYGDVLPGAIYDWDGGLKLSVRGVSAGEARETANGNNGEGVRDIYTNINLDGTPDAFDANNVSTLCPMMLDTTPPTVAGAASPGALKGHDLDGDLDVDVQDCQLLLDFVRGLPTSDFLSTGQLRGSWKLGSIHHSTPVVVSPDPGIFTRNPTLRTFQSTLLAKNFLSCPTSPKPCDAVAAFVTANDGMLHAFNAITGDELWTYIPRPLLGETIPDYLEGGTLVDLLWGERTLMDASPSVGFVWIDGYEGAGAVGAADGVQTASEWVRLLQVGMGGGGRYTLGLDITQPDSPYILWEDTAADALIGLGATTSSPGVGLILDGSTPTYASFYGSGLELDGYTESRLYIRSAADMQGVSETYDDKGISVFVDLDIDNAHDGTGLNSDPTVVDRNTDGFVDEILLGNSGGVLTKFVINTTDIDASSSCIYFDPKTDLTIAAGEIAPDRVPAHYPGTVAYSGDGTLLLFWGTGSPYAPFEEGRGGMYVLEDATGCSARATPLSTCSVEGAPDGYIPFDPGERLTGAPIVFNGVLYFTTFAPATDRCDDGEARLYGVGYTDCSAGFDTDPLSDDDALFISLGAGMASAPVVANGSIYVAITNPSDPDADPTILRESIGSALSSATAIQFREPY